MGTEVYDVDAGRTLARGVAHTDAEMTEALAGRVGDLLWDVSGRAEVRELLEETARTNFEQARLAEVLGTDPVLENWRVGEAFAEAHLVDERSCEFPWPGGRDLKSPTASPAGCDLVGFQEVDGSPRLAFAEAKTSEQADAPPSVVWGRTGLTGQLEGLRDFSAVKDHLVRYLGFHAKSREWEDTYQVAAGRYLADSEDVSLFGVLVRDIVPNQRDLESRATALDNGCPDATSIELRALYFPQGSVEQFATLAAAARSGAA